MKKRVTAGKKSAAPIRKKDGVLDVTILLFDQGYASTAIGPIEVFHSAGVVWNWLHGEKVKPRFRVRVASIDGKKVMGLCSLGFMPECSIHEIKHADIIPAPAPGGAVGAELARNTNQLPWRPTWYDRENGRESGGDRVLKQV